MNKISFVFAFFFCVQLVQAQYNQFKEISVEPVLKECAKSKEPSPEDVTCTYDKIYADVTSIINSNDNSKYGEIHGMTLKVIWNKNGQVIETELLAGKDIIEDSLGNEIHGYFRDLKFYPAETFKGRTTKYTLTHFFQLENNSVRIDSIVQPLFPGCYDAWLSPGTRKRCSSTNLLEYTYKNLKYPSKARKNRTEGMAVVKFFVNEDGFVEELSIARDPGDGCGEAAMEVIQKMNDSGIRWTPGKINGKVSRVRYTMPIKFKLASR